MSFSPQPPSSSSLSHTHSQSGRSTRNHGTISTVVTMPPWARDEPPSPKEEFSSSNLNAHQNADSSRPSDVASYLSSSVGGDTVSPSQWWSFTLQRPRNPPPLLSPSDNFQGLEKPERAKLSFKDRSMSWLPTSSLREGSSAFARRQEKEKGKEREREKEQVAEEESPTSQAPDWNLGLPPPPKAPFTMAQSQTPGWNTPWSARVPGDRFGTESRTSYGLGADQSPSDDDDSNKNISAWAMKKKKFRLFVLSNIYAPLLFRFINITFTAAALGIAIKIRQLEMRFGVMGALGSSPMLVIIFAPPTLLHVMAAIYLEYFGRPLGLWRTSHKLAHTLSEVLFICMWSAALSLCFDNYFTSLVPCASARDIRWYSELPRPESPIVPDLGRNSGGVADQLCDDQLALICLTGCGLVLYCTNLVISLFRIFDKVKFHATSAGLGGHP